MLVKVQRITGAGSNFERFLFQTPAQNGFNPTASLGQCLTTLTVKFIF